ncbi:conserved membrane hypothetical protein [Flavobacterium sp. 9AF]|uniref:DUF6427 family protein n=1 Tax=Flavobacterium sp. 9AF TaxID=2653142 RepID=UPI0012F26C04|nr:DUF6427 family protein [Flavobacterium sp. 9AF]VXC09366.1 conserved membrane hypothetical protein [Flavobacterium sp. 9AF]
MLASIFNKTRPFNYVIIGALLLMAFISYSISQQTFLGWQGILYGIFYFATIVGSCFLVNFIALKNDLSRNNSYTILFFFIFLLFFPTIFKNKSILISNFLLLLSLRRLISLKSMKNTKEKIFDASFWIFLAALFHFWSIVYILLVFISIILHVSRDYRNWIIPWIALFSVIILFFIFNIFSQNQLLEDVFNKSYISFDFTYFENIYQNIALAVFTSIAFLFFIFMLMTLSSKPMNMKTSYKKIIFSFLLGIAIYVLSAEKNNSCLVFTLAPLAILGSNFIENQENKILKEGTLYILCFFAIFFFVCQL